MFRVCVAMASNGTHTTIAIKRKVINVLMLHTPERTQMDTKKDAMKPNIMRRELQNENIAGVTGVYIEHTQMQVNQQSIRIRYCSAYRSIAAFCRHRHRRRPSASSSSRFVLQSYCGIDWVRFSLLDVRACVRACVHFFSFNWHTGTVSDHFIHSDVVQQQPIGHNVCVM